MAWPKGKPRKTATALDVGPALAAPAAPSASRKPLMRARPNWDDVENPEPDHDEGALHIPRDMFPPGFDFQWVTDSVYGQSVPQHRAKFERGLWTPVHQEDFDGIFDGRFMPKGATGEITVDGLVLMARPLKYSIEAKRREQQEARERVAIKEQQLRGGDMPGVTFDSRHPTATASNRINKTLEPVPIPRDGE